MEADLEEVLAIEAARSGEATGEATTVLRTLPGSARRRLPMRIRHPRRAFVATGVLVAVVVLAVLYLAVLRTHRGTGVATDVVVPAHLRPVPLSQSAAHDYNPYGSQAEHPDQVGLAVDSDPSTSWSTFHYVGGNLGKQGTGLYLDAKPGLAAKSIEIQTPTPGFSVQIYVANQIKTLPLGAPDSLASRGWGQPLAAEPALHDHQHLKLDTAGQPFRYYLVWITKLPPGSQSASISEITLFK
jgi:serine/threonine-protein kinase